MTTIYPKVRVSGAPGYGDFEGELVHETDAVDNRGPLAVVRYDWEDGKALAIVPRACVQVTRRVVEMEDNGTTIRVVLPNGIGYIDIEPGLDATLENRPQYTVEAVSTTIDTPAQDGRLYEVETGKLYNRLHLTGYWPSETE